MLDPTAAIVAVADAVEAIAQPDPEVVRIRAGDRSTRRQLRALRLLRSLKARLARLRALRGKAPNEGRLAALEARIDVTERLLTAAVLEP